MNSTVILNISLVVMYQTNVTTSHSFGEKNNYPQAIISLVQTIIALIAIAAFFRACIRQSGPWSPFTSYAICIVLGDLMFTFYNVLLTIQLFVGYWPFSERSCSVMLFLVYGGGLVVLYGELLIAINRIWAVYAPLHYRTHHTKRLAWLLNGVLWLLAMTFIVPFIALDDV